MSRPMRRLFYFGAHVACRGSGQDRLVETRALRLGTARRPLAKKRGTARPVKLRVFLVIDPVDTYSPIPACAPHESMIPAAASTRLEFVRGGGQWRPRQHLLQEERAEL